MHIPLVGERVWVSGCSHEFEVVRANYDTGFATIAAVADDRSETKSCRFDQLLSAGRLKPMTSDMREYSESLLMRQVRSTYERVLKSRELILRTDTLLRNMRLSREPSDEPE